MKILLHPLLILTAYAIEARQFPVKKVERNSDRFIVRYKNDDGRSSAHRAATEVHAHLAPQKAVAGTFSSEALEGLHNNSNIEYVEQDYLRYLKRGYDTNDLFKQQMYNNETGDENYRKLTETVPYGIPMVQADQVPYDSSNPRTVCIIDSGYALGHEDLPSTNVDGYSLDANFPWNQDNFGHGTHIAGR
jgi:serine protease